MVSLVFSTNLDLEDLEKLVNKLKKIDADIQKSPQEMGFLTISLQLPI